MLKPYFRKIYYYDTDKMGCTHHANYIKIMEEARTDMMEQVGYGFGKLEEIGLGSAVVSLSVDYKYPSTFGDTIRVQTAIAEINSAKLVVSYAMENEDGKLVCKAESTHVLLDDTGRLVSIKKACPGLYAALTAAKEEI